MKPVSIPLYRMDPAELNEFEAEIKDFLNKGFIQPSISPWGDNALFFKMKDEPLRICIY